MCGVEQVGQLGFAEAFRIAFTAAVGQGAVDQPAAVAGPVADQPGDRDPDTTLGGDFDDRGPAAWGPGGRLSGAKSLAGFVGETDPGVQPARDPLPPATDAAANDR